MTTVVVTDYEFADLDLERSLVEAAGLEFVAAQCTTDSDLISACATADGLINQYAQLTAAVLDALPRCQVVSRYGIGVNTIDVDAATAAGIVVANVPDGSLDDVSDHTAAMILSLTRGLNRYDASMRHGDWDYSVAKPLFRLRGRTLGLLGFGQIPQRLAEKMTAFGMRVLAHDPFADTRRATELAVELTDLPDLLTRADVLSVHVPLTAQTEGLIDAAALERMKPTAHLINTARGPVVDERALADALAGGRLAGAGLDVFAHEPLAADHVLRTLPGVLLSPHSAWYSEDSEIEIRTKTTRNVIDVLQGRRPAYQVNRDVRPRQPLA